MLQDISSFDAIAEHLVILGNVGKFFGFHVEAPSVGLGGFIAGEYLLKLFTFVIFIGKLQVSVRWCYEFRNSSVLQSC